MVPVLLTAGAVERPCPVVHGCSMVVVQAAPVAMASNLLAHGEVRSVAPLVAHLLLRAGRPVSRRRAPLASLVRARSVSLPELARNYVCALPAPVEHELTRLKQTACWANTAGHRSSRSFIGVKLEERPIRRGSDLFGSAWTCVGERHGHCIEDCVLGLHQFCQG